MGKQTVLWLCWRHLGEIEKRPAKSSMATLEPSLLSGDEGVDHPPPLVLAWVERLVLPKVEAGKAREGVARLALLDVGVVPEVHLAEREQVLLARLRRPQEAHDDGQRHSERHGAHDLLRSWGGAPWGRA